METKQIWKKNSNFILNRRIILESASMAIFCLVTETKGQTFRGIPGFYSTSGYTALIFFSAHLVAVKCEVFTITSTREMQLCCNPADVFPLTSGKSCTPVHCACAKMYVKRVYCHLQSLSPLSSHELSFVHPPFVTLTTVMDAFWSAYSPAHSKFKLYV